MVSETTALDSLDVVALWGLFVSFERRLADELRGLGLTVSSFRLIGEVMQAPEGIRQGELAKRLGVRPPSVSAAVKRLEEQGMVYRIPDPKDPRARLVCLSPGASLVAGVEVLTNLDSTLFGGMDEPERVQARALMQTLAQRMEKH